MTSITRGSTTTLFVSNVLNGGAAKGVATIDNSTVGADPPAGRASGAAAEGDHSQQVDRQRDPVAR